MLLPSDIIMSNVTHMEVPKNELYATLLDLAEQVRNNEVVFIALAGYDQHNDDIITAIAGDIEKTPGYSVVGALDHLKSIVIKYDEAETEID